MSKLPTVYVALVTIDHAVLAEANAMFDTRQASCEQIAAVDDEVFRIGRGCDGPSAAAALHRGHLDERLGTVVLNDLAELPGVLSGK